MHVKLETVLNMYCRHAEFLEVLNWDTLETGKGLLDNVHLATKMVHS